MPKITVRARTTVTYHGRSGKPIIHWTGKGRAFVMVRAEGGGVQRLYLDTKKAGKSIKGISKLRSEARARLSMKILNELTKRKG